MLFPIGDTPNPRTPAYANLTLIAINVLVFVLISLPLTMTAVAVDTPGLEEYLYEMARVTGLHPLSIAQNTTAYDVFTFTHGYRPASPSFYTLIASMFLHAGWAHLLGNMLFLWIFGDNVEHRLGSLRYVLAYLATGAAATLIHAAFSEEQSLPLVGASGAISGVMGFYFVWFPHNQVKLFFWLYFFVHVFLVPARLVLAFYLIFENLLPYVFGPGTSSTAYGAHIGGFVAGWMIARWMEHQPGDDEILLYEEPPPEPPPRWPGPRHPWR